MLHQSPLLHGEINTLLEFHKHNNALASKHEPRIDPKDCIFLSTHEPCSLCLSAITWCGFDNFYYLFTYVDTMDAFDIPHDIQILQQVFQTDPPLVPKPKGQRLYNRSNSYWQSFSIHDLINQSQPAQIPSLMTTMHHVKNEYNSLSHTYQASKAHHADGQIPLA